VRTELSALRCTTSTIPVLDPCVSIDDRVLCNVWNENYFCLKHITTTGEQIGNEGNAVK